MSLYLLEFLGFFAFIAILGYLVPAGQYYLRFHVFKSPAKEKRRVQEGVARPGQIAREVRMSLVSIGIFAAMATVLFELYKAGRTSIYHRFDEYPLIYLPVSVVLCFLIHDTYFYWTHRLMHWWLNSASDDEDRRVMLRLVTHLMFVGVHEFDCLYQAAFNGPIARWLIDSTGLPFDSDQLPAALRIAERTTWFCSITDSMQISEFYHLNNIEGVPLRPSWRTLAEFADENTPSRIEKYMHDVGLNKLVLLEDFVGTGTQMAKAVLFAARLPSKFPVLFCPILICPKGVERAQKLARRCSHLRFEPVFSIPQEVCLSTAPQANEDSFMSSLRQAVLRQHPGLVNPDTPYPAFGFRDTGAIVVMHTNTPNNTLPFIHHSSVENRPWSPLFRRSSRA